MWSTLRWGVVVCSLSTLGCEHAVSIPIKLVPHTFGDADAQKAWDTDRAKIDRAWITVSGADSWSGTITLDNGLPVGGASVSYDTSSSSGHLFGRIVFYNQYDPKITLAYGEAATDIKNNLPPIVVDVSPIGSLETVTP